MNLEKSNKFLDLVEVAKKNDKVIALILFGSYATGKQKPNSDIDLCIITRKDTMLEELSALRGFSSKDMDVLFYHNMIDSMKFRVFSEGKILVLNDKKEFLRIRRRFMHIFRDNYPFYKKNMERALANV